MTMARAIGTAATILNALLVLCCVAWSAATGFAFYERYWRVRHCFNELGRCWDAANQDVLLEQAGMIWGSAAVLGIALALLPLRNLMRSRSQQMKRA